ncbi:MAG: polyprenyl synthetase family protein [Saprospiraceae bacterium]
MDFLVSYKTAFENYLLENQFVERPQNLYAPVNYILKIGGKRIRPLMLLLASDLIGSELKNALPAALAVEVFHNFTLLHDDIMDQAPLRRGMLTVHTKYNINTAILSGDVMLIHAYNLLSSYDADISCKLMKVFNKMAIDVCEGQQLDMDFEDRQEVSVSEYIDMITKKTSVLIGASLQMGGILAGMDTKSATHLYYYGVNIGIAFQMQDDILDTFGDGKVGKQPGGDIIQNKKTYLYIKTMALADNSQQEELITYYNSKPDNTDAKVTRVREIMNDTHVKIHSEEVQKEYRQLAFSHLDAINLSEKAKSQFQAFGAYLLDRKM